MQLEELLNKKKLYEGIKEILEKVINSFSSINFNDDLLSARKTLSSYFNINDEDLYSNRIASVNDNININVDKLKEVVVNIDAELEKINNDIMGAELSGSM